MKTWIGRLLSGTAVKTNARDGARAVSGEFPLVGFPAASIPTKYIDGLTDEDLRELDHLLPWKCFTVDAKGRRFGDRAWPGKRETPAVIPDPRIVMMNDRLDLRGKRVLEFGCFEGVHTIALCRFGAAVTAVDSRIENVVKTIVRTAFFGERPTVFKCDVEDQGDWRSLPKVDFVHHVGVLYHLRDPVQHLIRLGALTGRGIMLDTHYALPDQAAERYAVDGREFAYRRYEEGGRKDVFSGMYDHAKWLTLDAIRSLLTEAGLPRIEVVEERRERNGPRVLLFALRG